MKRSILLVFLVVIILSVCALTACDAVNDMLGNVGITNDKDDNSDTNTDLPNDDNGNDDTDEPNEPNTPQEPAVPSEPENPDDPEEPDTPSEPDNPDIDEPIIHTCSFGDWIIIPSTCITKGSKTRYCECGEEETEELELDPNNHTQFSDWTIIPSTCTTQGSKSRTCECDYTETEELELDLNNHTQFSDWTIVPSTCTTNGTKSRTCECDYTETEELPLDPTAHKFEDTYSYNSTYHFYACEYCNSPQENIEHTLVDDACTICDYVVVEYTEGLVFTLDEESDTYSVTDYTGTSTEVIIPYIYEGKLVTSIGSSAFSDCDNLNSITIPASVTSIGNNAFDNCYNLTTVTFEENSQLTSIGEQAFIGCNLTSITIPASVTSIGEGAFVWCCNLTTVTFEENSQLTSIGEGAFFDCDNITTVNYLGTLEQWLNISFDGYSANPCDPWDNGAQLYINGTLPTGELVIPDTITEIKDYALNGCASITSVTIPASVTSIGDYAFVGCSNLTTVTFEENSQLTSIGEYAFFDCYNLVEVYNLSSLDITAGSEDNGGVGYYALGIYTSLDTPSKLSTDENGYIIYTDGEDKILVDYTGTGKELTLSGDITKIHMYAFYNNDNITSVTIPASVTSIGYDAFEYCDNLTTVTFEENSQLTSIGSGAFDGCDNLTSITIPASVTSIGSFAFHWCDNLTSITIPAGVTSIGREAFSGCDNLTTVTFEENSQLTSIGDEAFYNCSNLTSITIPASVTSIGEDAFYYCSNLTDIYYGGTEEQWNAISKGEDWDYQAGDYTVNYNYCTIVENSYTHVFEEWTTVTPSTCIVKGTETSTCECGYVGIRELPLDPTAHKFEDTYSYNSTYHFYACEYCNSPQENIEHTLVDDACTICDYVVLVFTLDEETDTYSITEYTGTAQEVIIPNIYCNKQVTNVNEKVFKGKDIKSIVLGANIKTIGSSAFYGCSNLTTVNYLGTLEQWLNISFSTDDANPCYNGAQLYINGTLLTELVIPDTITEIKNYAFSGCNSITSVTIPASVTSIGGRAFRYCSNLTTVTFEENSQLTSIGSGAFSNCDNLTTITIPASVTSIGSYAFYDCDNLTTVTFEENSQLTSIGSYAFYGCFNLTSITIPAGVTSIGDSAFYGCSNLTTVNYLGTLEQWLNISFGDDDANPCYYGAQLYIDGTLLTEVVIPDTIIKIKNYAFYNCSNLTSITIPASVTSIGRYAFRDCDNLTTVTFEENSQLTSIGSGAFSGCDNLNSITIPANVTSIGFEAFRYCYKLVEVYNLSSLNITIGSSDYGYVGHYALDIYTSLDIPSKLSTDENGYIIYTDGEDMILVDYTGTDTELTLPDGITKINKYAFYDNNNITSATIPASVTSIGEDAFRDCDNLTSIIIPASVTSIGDNAFNNCPITYANIPALLISYIPKSNLTTVIINSGTSIGYKAFYDCDNLTSITIPAGVTSIGDYAFEYCYKLVEVYNLSSLNITKGYYNYGYVGCYALDIYTSLDIPSKLSTDENGYIIYTDGEDMLLVDYTGTDTELTLPDGITKINKYAFYDNNNITSATIPASVTSIGSSAFYDCDNLTSITIPASVTSIGEDAFRNCDNLTSIIIPASVTSIGSYAFYDCENLTTVTFEENSQLTIIGEDAFYGCDNLTSVTIPASVTSIGDNAFSHCSKLNSITIPAGVTSIGEDAFWNCGNLTTVTFEENSQLTSIGSYAFAYCSKLNSITIPASVTSIGPYAFCDCDNLTTVNYSGTLEQWLNISFGNGYANPCSNGAQLYINGTLLIEVVIPDTITEIKDYAFRGCTSITSVTIPASVTSIGDYAFYDCDNLITVNYLGTLEQWLNISFEYGSNPCYNGAQLYINGTLLIEVVIPDTITEIKDYAFDGCTSITSVTIPASVTSIGGEAFYHCSNLTTVTFEENSQLTSIGWSAFDGCTNLTSITIPAGVTSIGDYAFRVCDNLTTVTFEENSQLTSIGWSAFDGCTNLTSITIPAGVTSIGDYAFRNCSNLTNITIPAGVTNIGYYTFSGCSNLTTVNYLGTLEQWLNISFGGYSANPCYNGAQLYIDGTLLTELVIPDTITKIKNYAFEGCTSITSVTIPASVTSIGSSAFDDCYKLVEVYNLSSLNITAGSTSYGYVGYYALGIYTSLDTPGKLSTDENGYIIYTDSEDKILVDYTGTGKELTLPGGITKIYKYAFYNNNNITSVTIPSSVTSIGGGAFYNCDNLTDIYYTGTEEQWNAISKEYNWDLGAGDYTIHYNYVEE